ncbi:MAG: Gfo/Idh/MocA family oxidoreductase [Candidatus Poribacteria bacterium]|nr:Gfo/Idh/MocA family oxidoreductase [Candidatus Poribacteria bacterium]
MSDTKYRVAIIGCGRMGQNYAEAYTTYPDTEIVAIVDANAQRQEVLGARFGVSALYPDVETLLKDMVPDIAVVVTPTKYMKDVVIACAEAGIRGISTEKPIAARLQDADAMVEACAERDIIFAGGNLQRAMNEVQEAAARLHKGEFGNIRGASVHGFGGEISGGGCQHISVLRLFTNAEVEEVIAWGTPPEALNGETDEGLIINGRVYLSNGLECSVFGTPTSCRGVDVWTDECLVRWDWNPPEIFKDYDPHGNRIRLDPNYNPYPWSEFGYLTGSIRSFLSAVDGNGDPWITGADLRQALEVAIAAKLSANRNSAPIKLPLEDRSLALYPRPYRWLGGDATGRPQSIEEAKS